MDGWRRKERKFVCRAARFLRFLGVDKILQRWEGHNAKKEDFHTNDGLMHFRCTGKKNPSGSDIEMNKKPFPFE